MLTIYVTRHGETKWNKEKRLQGWKDSELTEKGINNAILLGERLKDINLDVIYSSPSERALQTAKYVSINREVPIRLDANLKEINFGEWEGKTQEEIEQTYKREFDNFWNAPERYNHKPHSGESLAVFKRRVACVIKEIVADNVDKNILIVTHAVVIKAIMAFMMNIPTEKMWDPPFIHGTSLSKFQWDGDKFEVELLGDTSHLESNCSV